MRKIVGFWCFLAVFSIMLFGQDVFAQKNKSLAKVSDSEVVDTVSCAIKDGERKYTIHTRDGGEKEMEKSWPPNFSWDSSEFGPTKERPVIVGRHMNKIVFSSPYELGSFMHHGGVRECGGSTQDHHH